MNIPANHINPWIKATEEEKAKALAAFSGMPAQRLTSEIEENAVDASYQIALDGVTRYGLSEAVKAILKGSLGHRFYPNAVELRMECDKAMAWHEQMAARIRRQEQYQAERRENNRLVQRTPEAIARQQSAYQSFIAQHESSKGDPENDEAARAELRERYGITPEALAKIKDNPPLPSNFSTAKPSF